MSEKTYTKNEFITIYKDKKAGISIDIGKDDRMLIFYKDKTLIEIKEDGIQIKTDNINIDSNVNIKGNLQVQGNVSSSATIQGNIYGSWQNSNANFPANVNVNVDIDKYNDDKDEEIIQE